MRKLFLFLPFILVLLNSSIYAQAVGDYKANVTPGTWTTVGNWVKCVTAGTWVGATTATTVPSTTTSCFIPSGFSMTVPASGTTQCYNLTIDYGGSVTSPNTVTSPRYLKIYGSTVTVNGTFGGSSDGLSFGLNNAVSTTLTGSPTAFNICRIQPQVATTVIFDADCIVKYNGGTGSSAIYCNSLPCTFTINAGKTLTLVNGGYLSVGSSGTSDPTTGYDMTVNVYGTLITQTGSNTSAINLSNNAKTTVFHVYSTGTVNCGASLLAPSTSAATAVNVTVDAGGIVSFTGASGGGTCNISKAATTMNGTWDYGNVSTMTRSLGATASVGGKIRSKDAVLATIGTITLNPGSTVEYYGTSPLTGLSVSPVENLQINNSAGVTLGAGIVINNTLTLTSGKVTLGAYNLTAPSINGGSSSSYVVTNGTGGLVRNVGAGDVLFPVGYTDTYTPVMLNNSGDADNFTVTVKNSFDNAPVPLAVVNKQWTITEGTPGGSNATVKLQWNTADENPLFVRTNPILIGRFNGSIWEGTSASYADLGGGVYTASVGGFTAFSPFTVGNEPPLPVELSSFTSNVNGRDINLNWETKTEKNSNKFEIERLANTTWANIGSVKAFVLSNSPKQYSFNDKNLQTGKYQYRLKMIDNDGSFQYSNIVEAEIAVPGEFELNQNYPNPFNPSTKINYSLPSNSQVTLEVFNISGERIALLVNQNQSAGFYSVNFVNKNISSGVYFYHLVAVDQATGNNFSSIKKMLLLK
jgi:hypothetical protein